MSRRFLSKVSLFSGLLLVLVLVIALINGSNPIGFSKNALFRAKAPETILEVPGELAWAGGDTYYNYDKGNLKKIRQNGEVIWDTVLKDKLLWMGPEGLVYSKDDTFFVLDTNGEPVYEKSNFLNDPRILCVQKQYLLLSGKSEDVEYAMLLNKSGDIVWQVPLHGSIISGSIHPKGIYAALNIIDDKATFRIAIVNFIGEILWEETFSDSVYQVKTVDGGIGAILADKALLADTKGRHLWEYCFKGQVLRGDIGDDGFITAVIKEVASYLSQEVHLKIMTLTPNGNIVCSYSLDDTPNFVRKSDDFLYLVDDYGIMILSKEGLLVSNIVLRNVTKLVPAEPNHIIAVQHNKSSLIQNSHGR